MVVDSIGYSERIENMSRVESERFYLRTLFNYTYPIADVTPPVQHRFKDTSIQ